MAKESKRAQTENKKRGERMYVRLSAYERATRWPTIVAHAFSLMFKGEPDHRAAAEAKKRRDAKKPQEVVQIVPLPEATAAAIRTPVSEPPAYNTQAPSPSGTYDHDYYFNMYRHRPVDPGKDDAWKDDGNNPFIPHD